MAQTIGFLIMMIGNFIYIDIIKLPLWLNKSKSKIDEPLLNENTSFDSEGSLYQSKK